MRISNELRRTFYEIEADKCRWNVNELERQIATSLFERIAKGKNREQILRLACEGQEVLTPADAIRDPMVLEFLNLPESHKLIESDLEEALISHLQDFLLELGQGFAFVGRQQRLSLDGDHFYADLVLGKMLDNNNGDGKLLKNYLKSKNIGWLVPDVTSVKEMYFSPYEIRLYRIKQGDLLFSEGGEVGKTSFWNNDVEECYIQNSVHKFTINRFNYSRYFMYLSYAAGHSGYYDSIVNFVSIKHLTKEKLSRVIWSVPSVQEQKTIADYLDTKTAQIDRIIETINTQIEKLKELRKTIINDVVTGKIKVAQ